MTDSTEYRDAVIEPLAYNNGAMEYRLLAVWQSLQRIIQNNISYDSARLVNELSSVIESIETTADLLKPKTSTDGTVQTAWLKDHIYANRK